MSPRDSERPGTSRVDGKGRAAAIFTALTLLLSYPLAFHLSDGLLADNPDAHLFMWTLSWDTHAFLAQPLGIFDANIYYPQAHTLAYSENLIGSAFFAAPVLWLTGNPVLALNLVLLLGITLSGLGAYVLARRLGIGFPGALLCGVIFAFAPPRFFRIAQLHMTAIQWIPFALAALHAYFDGGRKWDLRLWAAFFTLQALASGHGAVFVSVATAALVVYRFGLGEPIAFGRRIRDLGLTGVALLALVAVTFIPYRAVQIEMGLRRSLVKWAPSPESFLASPTHVQSSVLSLAGLTRVNEEADAYLFPGYLPLILAGITLWRGRRVTPDPARPGRLWPRVAVCLEIVALVLLALALWVTMSGPIRLRVGSSTFLTAHDPSRALLLFVAVWGARMALLRAVPFAPWIRLRRGAGALAAWAAARRRDMRAFYALLTLLAVCLTAGPPIGLWPLVYWLPGLNFIRVPSRFMIVAVMGLAVLAGFGFDRLTTRLTARSRGLAAAGLGLLLVIEFAAVPLRINPYQVPRPAVERWLAEQRQPFSVVEVPMTTEDRNHTRYMLHSMAHWQKTVHGYSGIRPALHAELYSFLRTFPNSASLDTLDRLGVDYVVAHTELYPPGEWARVEERLKGFEGRVQLVHTGGEGRVYRLVRGAEN